MASPELDLYINPEDDDLDYDKASTSIKRKNPAQAKSKSQNRIQSANTSKKAKKFTTSMKQMPVSEVIAFTANRTSRNKPSFHISDYVNVNSGMSLHESLIEPPLNEREWGAEWEMLLYAQREREYHGEEKTKEVKKATKPRYMKTKQTHNTSKVGQWVITKNNREVSTQP